METGSGTREVDGLPPSLRSRYLRHQHWNHYVALWRLITFISSWLRSGGSSYRRFCVITPMTSRTSRWKSLSSWWWPWWSYVIIPMASKALYICELWYLLFLEKIPKNSLTQHSDSYSILHASHSSPAADEKLAGVRDGVAGPRDQPPGSLQVRRPPQDRPQPVERRFLPFRSFSELPQWLWQEVEEAPPPLVCSSQPLFLVWHARTLSPMSDTLVVYICIALDKHALPRCFSFPLWHIHGCHFFNYFSPGVFSALYWLWSFSSSFWLVCSSSQSSGVPAAFPISAFNPVPPLGISACPACQFQRLKWSVHVLSFQQQKTSPLPSCYKRIVSAFWMSRIIPFLLFEASPNSTYSPQWMPRVLLIYFCLLPAYECPVRSTNLSRSPSVLTIVINKQIILVNICVQMMMMNSFAKQGWMENRKYGFGRIFEDSKAGMRWPWHCTSFLFDKKGLVSWNVLNQACVGRASTTTITITENFLFRMITTEIEK